MAQASEIPITGSQPQSFSITLGGISYGFSLYWLQALAQCWQLDISNSSGDVLIAGVPLLPGANILAQHAWLGFPGELWVLCDTPGAKPTFADLGTNSHLYFVTP